MYFFVSSSFICWAGEAWFMEGTVRYLISTVPLEWSVYGIAMETQCGSMVCGEVRLFAGSWLCGIN